MPANTDPLERWLNQQARPLVPPPGTFELITRRARRRRLRRAAATVVAAAAVAASVAVATVSPTLLRLAPPSESEQMAAGDVTQAGAPSPPNTTQQPNGSARLIPSSAAVLSLAGGTGYLIGPDGTLFSGAIGQSWARVGTTPCQPAGRTAGPPLASGFPATGTLASYGTNLALACGGGPSAIWASADGGARWTRRAASGRPEGTPTSLAAAPDGNLVLATTEGIYLLTTDATAWRKATARSGSGLPGGGFGYVGMTTDSRGAALPANTSLHQVWVTADGGRTWVPRPVG